MNDRITVESLGWIVQPTYRLYTEELGWHTVTLEDFNDLLNDDSVDVGCNNRAVWIRDPECTLKIKHKKGALDGMDWTFLHTKFKLGGEEE
tara:strand:+ start:260 stop:532 length:273 start_codon:yes stop_codon:yes gene_type:complete